MATNVDSYNASVEAIREHEYPMLKDDIYLDHAGTTLYSRSLVDRFAADMMTSLLGNPHAASASSQAAGRIIEDVRLHTLQFFHADPAEFDLVFVANATAGAKLVAEAFRSLPGGFSYAYHQACHTSLVGVREEAQCAACLTSEEVEAWAMGNAPELGHPETTNTLFAYPAQSNMDGRRFSLAWAHSLRNQTNDADGSEGDATSKSVWTLLDAAAYAATSELDLGNAAEAPDFTIVSFYKIFGLPDLAGLIVRRPAEAVFDTRRYFGGGTVDMVVCSSREQWHATKGGYEIDGDNRAGYALHDRVEDGTLPIHSIAALGAALDTHTQLFGSMLRIAAHTSFLADRLHDALADLRHGNGAHVCRIYSPERHTKETGGPIVAFNLQNSKKAWVSLGEFDKLATLKKIHLRTGGVCNPGGVAAALGLAPWEMRRNFSRGMRCGSDDGDDDIVAGKPTGIIRLSLGAMSTMADVDRFLAFIKEFYIDETKETGTTVMPIPVAGDSGLVVASISVYPIKSCGAYDVPRGTRWAVRPEGLVWDREWCLVHRVTRRALSQKQYPSMALLRPKLDFDMGVLRVSFAGPGKEWIDSEITVPLSNNPAMYATTSTSSSRSRASRVCGENITAQVYTSNTINDFFSRALGVPCLLARFPPGGQGAGMRHAKAHLQKYQRHAFVDATELPSPPDSDSERASSQANTVSGRSSHAGDTDVNSGIEDGVRDSAAARQRRHILLHNESPILVIHTASLRELSEAVRREKGRDHPDIAPSIFRANVVLDHPKGQHGLPQLPYAEDGWSRMHIGQQPFKMLGACRRCHMVCINQETADKSNEPFVTLTKTRRFDGKVFFGTHMAHDPDGADATEECKDADTLDRQFPTIIVGDASQPAIDQLVLHAASMEAVTLADYQRSVLRTAFRSAVARDEARPFTLLACFVPTIVVPAVFIAVAGRHTALRPLRYVLAAALVAFQVNQLTPLWNTDGSWTRISSLNFACAYGAGISISWGTMWALNVLVWTNPWNGERVARRTRRGPPETGPDGIMDTAEAPDEDIARSLRLGHEYYWQSFPVHASFMARIDWAIDLCFAWRGVGWSWCRTPVPHFAPPIQPHTNELVRLSSIPESTRHGYSRHRTWASFYRSRLATFVGSYLVLDVCAVIMTNDPHFVVGPAPSRRVPWSEQIEHFPYPAMGDVRPAPPSPALFAIPAYLQTLYRHPEWLELYRSLLGLVAMMAALQIALHLDQLLRVSFARLFIGPDSMSSFATASQLWHYPSPFGSVSQVLDHGLNGFWGSFWHQTLREGFSAPTQWLTEQGLLPAGNEAHLGPIEPVTNGSSNSEKWKSSASFNGDVGEDKHTKGVQDASNNNVSAKAPHKKSPTPLITRFVGLVLAFGQSALLHSAASMTTLPTHTLWQGPALFFLLAGVGVATQSTVIPKPQSNKLSRYLHQVGDFLFALGWLHGTSWLFVDDQARCGIWLFEPVPFSPTRFIISLVKGGELPSIVSPGGSNRAGHSAWRWYKDDFVHWYTGKTWWDSGIAL